MIQAGDTYRHVSDVEGRCIWVIVSINEDVTVVRPRFDDREVAVRTLDTGFFTRWYEEVIPPTRREGVK